MKFLAKWYLLFFIALSSLVFVGCGDPNPQSRVGRWAHELERDYGFSHGTAVFIASVVFVLMLYVIAKNRKR
ncbi:hypothetical protein HG560_06255 [Helicobacter pylori]|uniref:Lipoprotein n=2 Tax=Helicobacter pylori TaxID=210 RepID=A0AAE7P4Z4_HELPX|nr:hypothetical protein [Helicobacter pylori]ADO04449.1 hypothetical protein HPCU_06525 [Helicobacter pylori Cuz20]AFI01467.1 hypothetical protein HPSH112_06390 [Helicobacter pylori Shi112]QQW94088.1 hypothetical protein HG560_06255 [Helicobacter pylori]QQX50056.1 hypothetical protein HG562_06270 [Helicobacter pylori]